jgi:hypothetical protein
MWAVLTLMLLLVLAIGGCEARKAYYDWQVRKMCEQDGGVTVFERVIVTKEEYKALGGTAGEIPVYELSSTRPHEPYFTETRTTYLRQSNPEVRREERILKRRGDGKVLARYVYYARVGGDVPSWAHPSSKGCIPLSGGMWKQVFHLEGEAK